MENLSELASQWTNQARALCEAMAVCDADDVNRLLDAIDAGIHLRRQLDTVDPAESVAAVRRDVVRNLTRLQERAKQSSRTVQPQNRGAPCSARRINDWLVEAQAATRDALARAREGALRQALLIEGLRADLDWQSSLVALSDGETPPPLSAALEVELDRLSGWLAASAEDESDLVEDAVQQSCDRMQGVILDRRICRELAQPISELSPPALWTRRFGLSRLESHVSDLESSLSVQPDREASSGSPADWRAQLERRRAELAELAEERTAALPPTERGEHAEEIVRAAADEVGETIAFLEDMPLRRGVNRLRTMCEDLERLSHSCRLWSRDPTRRPMPQNASASAAIPVPSNGRNGPAVAGESVSDSDRTSTLSAFDQVRGAARLMHNRARHVERLSRQVRAEWQEKLLARRMEAVFGRRFVAILETTVLVLILVLVGLIAAEAALERASPAGLSVGQHEFFAWADLVVCSVFLFELAIKLVLAPNRFTYFLRHLLIDFVPSLPFGFVAHMFALEQLESAIETASQTSRFGARSASCGWDSGS